ncbi:MAG: hypothetical protein ABR564_01555 [Candidatus Dormibacteria bacterium]
MAVVVAASPPTKPPTTEECGHPAPITGIMAHEFAPYQGAMGPEGARRTTTHYGPIIGGLPIQAWHCQLCGLLRLSYPDGRREERTLYPGPQPGLLALATPIDAPHTVHGRQARVSGLSADAAFFERNEAEPGLHVASFVRRLPAYDAVTWITLAALLFIAGGLLLAGYLAVYDYQTPGSLAPLATLLAAVFGAVLALQIMAALFRHLFPAGSLPVSVAVAGRGAPAMNGAARGAVWLLGVAMVGLLITGYLAVYDYQTSSALTPVFIVTMFCGLGAVVLYVGDAIRRHLSRH